jgi:acyl-CoA synthetase (AMP-forming)/AMP-acid ligase II
MDSSKKTVTGLLAAQAAARGEATALRAPGGQRMSYRRLNERVAAVGRHLAGFDLDRGDRVLVPAANTMDSVVAVLAALSVAVAVPVNPRATLPELTALRARTRPALVLAPDQESVGAAEFLDLPMALVRHLDTPAPGEAHRGARPGDLAVLIGTSGSIDAPRLVALTHEQWLAGARRPVDRFRVGRADRVLNLMPLFHNHGLNGAVLATLCAGGEVMCPGTTDLARLPDWLTELRPTWATGAPTVHAAMHDAVVAAGPRVRDALRLRFVRSASAPLPEELKTGLETVFGAPVVEIWGLTEAAGQVTANGIAEDERRVGTVGRACHGFELAVVDEAGATVPAGQRGEILVRGGVMSAGYFDDPAANAELLRGGWLRTRDLGAVDDDGYLTVFGRVSDYANRGGDKVWLPEIDRVTEGHPGVAAAMAFALPHPRLGHDIAVAVVAEGPAGPAVAEIRNFLRARLPAPMIPSRVEFLSELPVGPTGKAQRKLLRERFAPAAVPAAPRRERTPVGVVVAALWCDVLGLEDIDDDVDFLASGGDSILATKLVASIADVLGVELSVDVVLGMGNTVAAMTELVSAERDTASA